MGDNSGTAIIEYLEAIDSAKWLELGDIGDRAEGLGLSQVGNDLEDIDGTGKSELDRMDDGAG